MKKFYITTSIAYVNAPPHLGYIWELLQADVLARFHRAQGERVRFVTGTDEHGAKIVRAAESAGKRPKEFVDEISQKFQDLQKPLEVSADDFIRTSDVERHFPTVHYFWQKLIAAGDIYKKTYQGLYCVGHEAFITKKELVNGKCIDHDKEPELIEEENYFFRLSKYSKEIGQRIRGGELKILPVHREHEILSLIDTQGLEDVSFSRPRKDLSWGIPVPGDESQTIYVWADALVNYLTAVGYPEKKYGEWWPADVHVIGKDILRFHAAIWPGMLLAAGLPLPHALFVHGFVTVQGRKMSKTIGNVIGMKELEENLPIDKSYGVDALRYFLLREIPSGEDGDFSYDKFWERYEGDLMNGIGNFISRIGALAEKSGAMDFSSGGNPAVQKQIGETEATLAKKIEEFKLHEALAAIWQFLQFGDSYINETQPWKTGNLEVVTDLARMADAAGRFIAPFMPHTAAAIKKCFVRDGNKIKMSKPAAPLFPKRNVL